MNAPTNNDSKLIISLVSSNLLIKNNLLCVQNNFQSASVQMFEDDIAAEVQRPSSGV